MESPEMSSAGEPLSEATFLILLALAPGPSHGYAIIKDVRQISAERVILSTGTLYGALKRLLDLGWIERVGAPDPADTTRTPRAYRLTNAGQRALAAEAARMQALARLAERYTAAVLP